MSTPGRPKEQESESFFSVRALLRLIDLNKIRDSAITAKDQKTIDECDASLVAASEEIAARLRLIAAQLPPLE